MPGVAERDIVLRVAREPAGFTPAGPHAVPETGSRRNQVARAVLAAGADCTITWLCGIISFIATNPGFPGAASEVPTLLGMIALLVVASLWERGLYSPPALFARELPLRNLALGWLQAIGFTLVLAFCVPNIGAAEIVFPGIGKFAGELRGMWMPVFLVSGLIGLASVRFIQARVPAGSAPTNRTVIIGANDLCKELVARLQRHGRDAWNIMGVVDIEPANEASELFMPRTFCGLPLIGQLEVLEQMIRQDEVDAVLVALPWSDCTRMRAVVGQIAMAPVDVYIVPGIEGLALPIRQAPVVGGIPLLLASNRPLGEWQAFVKRAEDLVLGSLLLLLTAPAMLGIALAIKLTSNGPVFFRQRRLGFNNRLIEVFKFRTMYTHLTDPDARQQALRGDKRVTPLGAWLRRTSLDELPQLLNVLTGDMSLVGPRPHALQTTAGGLPLEEVVPIYSSRHRVKPGITGWAQINGYRGALDTVDKIVHRVNHDLHYIENWSLMLDLRILWRTVRVVLFDDNAF
jgi:Undecaprenyl-phosphate glucose phosphotransferase